MEGTLLSKKTKKTLLELHYSKYLQHQTNSLITMLTLLIGLVIALVTKEIIFTDYVQMAMVGFVVILIITPALYYFINARNHLKQIPEEMKKLNL